MSWFFPFPDSWKKRACRYLLQRYLGQFLEEKLTLDQLSVDLYNGTGSVSDVCLDVQGLNELAEQQSLPLEFVDGYIGEMSVSIPWATILRDSSYVQITGMVITVQPKQRAEEMGAGSLFESMISTMTSSIQLATEIQQTEPPDHTENEPAQAIEGIELIARTLESILCKVKVKFVDTTIRLEHVPKGSKTGVALEIRIKNMDYCDEAGCDIESSGGGDSTPTSPIGGEAAFAIKKFHLDGVSLYTDEFPTSARTMSRPLLMSLSQEAQQDEARPGSSPSKDFPSPDENKKPFEPVLFGKLVGRQELRVKVKQSEVVPGPKVDLEVNMGSLLIFSTPRQVHLLQELLHGLSTPGIQDSSNVIAQEKRMNRADFERVGLDLLHQLHPGSAAQDKRDNKGLGNVQGWSAADPDEDSDEEFHPIGGGGEGASSSRGGSLASSMDSSTMSSASGLSKSASTEFTTRHQASSYFRHQGKRKKYRGNSSSDPDPGSDRNHYHIRLSSLAIVLLHEDILTTSADSSATPGGGSSTTSSPGGVLLPSSVRQLNAVAETFFAKLALFAISPHGNKDFRESRSVFLNAVSANHIRLLAAPVMLELDEKDSTMHGTLTGGSVELLECLVEEADDKKVAQYLELLKFMREDCEVTDPKPKHALSQQPDIKIKMKHCKKSARSSTNSVEISVHLEQCWSELDISIMDRISVLLNPKPLCSIPSQYKADNTMQSAFDQAIETCSECDSKLEWKLSSPFLVIKLRFPIPDLRPLHDISRPPWWRLHLHPDFAWLHLSDITLRSHLTPRQPALSFELTCTSALALYQTAPDTDPVPFGFTTCCPENSGSYIQDVGWPRLVIRIYSSLDLLDLEDPLEDPQCMTTSIIEAPPKIPSPFTFRKVFHDGGNDPHAKSNDRTLYEGEELVIPGDKEEISNFIDDACRRAHIQVDVQLPTAHLQFPNKHLYELIYNRFTSDLLLWTPSAPASQSWTQNINVNYNNVFSRCKSQDSDTDEDSEEEDGGGGGMFYSTHDHRTRKPRLSPQDQFQGQSKVTISLSVSQCVVDLYTNVLDEQGSVVDGQCGQVVLSCEDVHVFTVSKYKGKTGNSFVIVQVNNAALHHSDKVSSRQPLSLDRLDFPPACDHLIETIYKSDDCSIPNSNPHPVGCGTESADMLTVAVHTYLDDRQIKMNRVSCCLRNATLRHRTAPPHQSVHSQLIDFFDVIDYPVTGYEPLPIVVEYHQHFFDCAIDYRPLYLSFSSLISLGSFSICCNIVSRTSSSTLRFIAEDIGLFLSNKTRGARSVDLKQDYVCVIEIGLFELSVRVSDAPSTPHLDLRAWNNMVHIRTCSDSARALLQLLAYIGSDGDLKPQHESVPCSPGPEDDDRIEGEGQDPQRINEMMEEAMSETVPPRGRHKNNSGSEQQVEVFLFPDEGNGNELDEEDLGIEDDEYLDKEFCFLENEAGSGFSYQTKEPEVHLLTTSPIRLIDNHFSTPLGKADLLQPPKHFPTPTQRYTLRETTIVWHIYGGSDFAEEAVHGGSSVPTSPGRGRGNSIDTMSVCFSTGRLSGVKEISFSPRRESLDSVGSLKFGSSPSHSLGEGLGGVPSRWQNRGGPCRQHHVKMQLQLSKLRFQHDVYPDTTSTAQRSRQVILIHDVEVRDRLATSNINKFLYAYSSKARPRQSHAHMVVLKALHVKSEHSNEELESCIKVSMLPLRLNIDQDAILFLFTFATELAGVPDDKDNVADNVSVSSAESSPSISSGNKKSPIFIKSFVFSPEVLIRLDYQGKHVDMSHGPLAGILMGLAQLNCSEIRLKKINHRHGLLGFNKLLSFIQSEWSQDIYKNQLPSLLGGVGPMYSLVQLAQGIRDLFWLPIEQYQKDGRIVRGLQRGANSFTTSTAMAALELTARIVMAIQTVAETAFDMVSPGPSVKRHRHNNSGKKKKSHNNQPIDIREGVSNAYTLMREGLGETAQTLLRVASEEHEAKGAVGAVGGVLRQIPPTAIKPIILASKATSNVLGGVKSQLVPDARKEAAHKWRQDET
uniref:Autophagy-related protein 2 n=3 Tax=Cacopsylla melanoneura TaxID=428564 RepID=A0A8D8U0S0_9HEMI